MHRGWFNQAATQGVRKKTCCQPDRTAFVPNAITSLVPIEKPWLCCSSWWISLDFFVHAAVTGRSEWKQWVRSFCRGGSTRNPWYWMTMMAMTMMRRHYLCLTTPRVKTATGSPYQRVRAAAQVMKIVSETWYVSRRSLWAGMLGDNFNNMFFLNKIFTPDPCGNEPIWLYNPI